MKQDVECGELVLKAIAGDRGSLSELAELAWVRVRIYVRRVIVNEDRAQDITQEAIVVMLSSLDQLQDPLRFWPWIFTIASNKVRQSFRRTNLRRVDLSDVQGTRLEPTSNELDPAERLSRHELVDLMQRAFDDLDVYVRMVLAMRFYGGMSHAAISNVLGCSETAARVIVFRAKRVLARALRDRGLG